jgi:holliday junction DNA helicase RuvB
VSPVREIPDPAHPAPAHPAPAHSDRPGGRGGRVRGEGRVRGDRVQDPEPLPDEDLDRSLRPRRLEDFVGQEAVKDQLAVSIAAAASRGEALDHVLLAGPPGLGKTSLAQIVAAELDVPFVQTAGPALERKGDVAAFLTALEPRAVFFVDEIHRLPRALEETFYPALEDGCLPITVGQGAGARVVTLPLPPFTLIGATTRAGLITTPLRDRFGIQHRLEHYGLEDLATIVRRSARLLEVAIEDAGARAIAERSRGTPRVANRLLKRVRDYAEVRGTGVVTGDVSTQALDLLGVDHAGLDRLDREILRAICEKFGGGPVGLSTLAVAVGEEQDTIEDVYEPYLLQRGLIERTPRGRAATRHAFEHLGLQAPGPLSLL